MERRRGRWRPSALILGPLATSHMHSSQRNTMFNPRTVHLRQHLHATSLDTPLYDTSPATPPHHHARRPVLLRQLRPPPQRNDTHAERLGQPPHRLPYVAVPAGTCTGTQGLTACCIRAVLLRYAGCTGLGPPTASCRGTCTEHLVMCDRKQSTLVHARHGWLGGMGICTDARASTAHEDTAWQPCSPPAVDPSHVRPPLQRVTQPDLGLIWT